MLQLPYICIYILPPWANNVCCLSTHTNTHILEWFATSQGVRETEWRGRGGSCLPLRSLPPLRLWWQHMTSPPFRPEEEEETRRQSTGTETQRMSLAAAAAGCGDNMAAALVVTGVPNLLNKRSIQGRRRWHHGEKSDLKKRQRGGGWRRKKFQRMLEYHLAQYRDYADYLNRE